MSNWIKIKDEHPDDFEDVLMIRENLSMGIGCIINCGDYVRLRFDGTSKAYSDWKIKPTHWQSLPEPPK